MANRVDWTALLALSVLLAFVVGFYFASQASDIKPEITGFTVSVGGGTNLSRLIAYDQGDSEGGSRATLFRTRIMFFANYTNSTTNLSINSTLGGLCNITFDDSVDNNMTFNSSSQLFEYNRTDLAVAGNLSFNITCSAAGYEQWNVSDNITIQCGYVNANMTLPVASINSSSCYIINASNLVLECGGNITGSSTGTAGAVHGYAGVDVGNTTNITTKNCVMRGFDHGVLYLNVTGGSIINVTTNGTGQGSIHIMNASHNLLLENITVTDSFKGIRIDENSTNVTVRNSLASTLAQTGFEAALFASRIYFINNTCRNSSNFGCIYFTSSTNNNTVTNNTVTDNYIGITINTNNGGSVFSGNTLINNSYGYDLASSAQNNNISGEQLDNNTYGIYFENPNGNNSFVNINITNSGLVEIFSDAGPSNISFANLTIRNGSNVLRFSSFILNGSYVSFNSSNYYMSTNIAGVNTVASPFLNISTRVCINFNNTCTPTIYAYPNFTTNVSLVTSSGTSCTSSSDPSCIIDSCAGSTVCFNVSHWSTYATSEPEPSSSSSSVTIPSSFTSGVYSLGPTTPAGPKDSQSSGTPKEGQTGNLPFSPQVNPYPCVFVDKKETSSNLLVSSGSADLFKLKSNETPILQPFKANCESKLDLTLNLPDLYKDIRVIKCDANQGCADVMGSYVDRLDCGTNFHKDISRTTVALEVKDFPIKLLEKEASNVDALESGYKIMLQSVYSGKIKVSPLTTDINEPANRFARIVGTPVELMFGNGKPQGTITITLPYALKDNVDEQSIAIYIYKNKDWIYVNGRVDNIKKTVSAEFTESSISENMIIAPIGVFCYNCLKSQLLQFYNGTTNDSVVIIHGLEIAPGRLQDIMNDIRLTNQPWQGWTFEYLSNRTIDDSAKDLADLLEANSGKYDRIYIAAHSMGGIITQQALRYAYEQNQKKLTYTFLSKVKKIVVIASPNKGTIREGIYKDLFEFLIRSEKANELFNFNSQVIRELIQGRTVDRVPDVNYLVIAGTRPYDFLKTDVENDGIVTVQSAQFIGGQLVADRCSNFWDINITHTEILNNKDSRRVIERIVASEIAESQREHALMGYNQYYRIQDDSCSPNAVYAVVGKKINPAEASDPGNCACGNKVCGVDENEINCPVDCARIEAPKTSFWNLLKTFLPIWTIILFLLLLICGTLLVIYTHRKHKKEHYDALIASLEQQMGQELDSGKVDDAIGTYNKIQAAFSEAPKDVKEKHFHDLEELNKRLVKKI